MNERAAILPVCQYCRNIFTKECAQDCFLGDTYKFFQLRPGVGIRDLPAFPMDDFLNYDNGRFRMIVFAIYLAAITDFLQHQEEYDFRDGGANGHDSDGAGSGQLPQNQ